MIEMQIFLLDDEYLGEFYNEAVIHYNVPVYKIKGEHVKQLAEENPMISRNRLNYITMIITMNYNGSYQFKC